MDFPATAPGMFTLRHNNKNLTGQPPTNSLHKSSTKSEYQVNFAFYLPENFFYIGRSNLASE